MNLHWYIRTGSDGNVKYLDKRLLTNFKEGLRRHSDDSLSRSYLADFDGEPVGDVALCFGYSAQTRAVMDAYHAAGKHYVMFDKGMVRKLNKAAERSRVMINGGHPLKSLMRGRRNGARWENLKTRTSDKRGVGDDAPIVLAINSEKHCSFWGIKSAWEWSARVVEEIRRYTDRPIIFRPKPKGERTPPIEGTTYSDKPDHIEDALKGAWCLVTHTSSCAINALLMGIPAICLGPCAASPVSGDSVADVVDPKFPGPDEYERWLHNLAWFEWTGDEFASGEAWGFIKRELA